MVRVPQDGDFYIQQSNQDFWLREHGVWVRKGNIRDEGASGVLAINPLSALGFQQSSPLTRERFIEFDQAYAVGFDLAVAISKSRDINAGMGFGVADALILDRTRELSVAINLGFDLASQFGINLFPAAFGQGFDMAATILRDRQFTLNMQLGFSQTPTPVVDHGIALSAALDLGYLMSVGLTKTKALAAAMAIGFTEGVTLVVSVPLPATSHLYGYDQATTLTHANSTPVVTKLTDSIANGTPGDLSGTDDSAITTVAFNSSAGQMLVIDIARGGVGDVTSTTTVTDSAGLTWHQQSTVASFHATPAKWYRVERWWAYSAAAHTGMTISYTFHRSSGIIDAEHVVYGITNVPKANGGAPFLSTGSATLSQNSSTPSAMSTTVNPGNLGTCIVMAAAIYRDANTTPTAGSGYTARQCGNATSSGVNSFISEYSAVLNSPGTSKTANFTNNQAFWDLLADTVDCT